MRTIRRHSLKISMVILACAGVLTLVMTASNRGTAHGAGMPVTDPLFYSGNLTDQNGKPLQSSQVTSISVNLWTAATIGTKVCGTTDTSPTLLQGRFRLKLSATCLTAIHSYADLWTEVVVNTKSMGRSKIGAVPYAVEKDDRCPSGYTWDSTIKTITLCKRGKDEMVKVGDFWIDRYEVVMGGSQLFNGGTCDGGPKPIKYGMYGSDNYPTTFPDSGYWSTKVYACSVAGAYPSVEMTWFQAQQGCVLVGKHLCSNAEWQAAAAGTPDTSTSCNVSTKSIELTGSRPKCASNFGAMDMVGNLWEWVAWWGQAGKVNTSFSSVAKATPWPSGYGDGKDLTLGINGETYSGTVWTTGLPAALLRGGTMSHETNAGVFAVYMSRGPSHWSTTYGARCCRH